MGLLKFEVAHSLSKDEAKKRIEQLLKYWQNKYGVASNWTGDSAKIAGKVMKIDLNATLAITDKAVVGEATDPGFLLRTPARNYLNEKFSSYLDPNTKPES